MSLVFGVNFPHGMSENNRKLSQKAKAELEREFESLSRKGQKLDSMACHF